MKSHAMYCVRKARQKHNAKIPERTQVVAMKVLPVGNLTLPGHADIGALRPYTLCLRHFPVTHP